MSESATQIIQRAQRYFVKGDLEAVKVSLDHAEQVTAELAEDRDAADADVLALAAERDAHRWHAQKAEQREAVLREALIDRQGYIHSEFHDYRIEWTECPRVICANTRAVLTAASVDAATAADQEVAVDPEYHRFEQHMDRILGKRPDESAGGGHE